MAVRLVTTISAVTHGCGTVSEFDRLLQCVPRTATQPQRWFGVKLADSNGRLVCRRVVDLNCYVPVEPTNEDTR
jgi:hypothetical protein